MSCHSGYDLRATGEGAEGASEAAQTERLGWRAAPIDPDVSNWLTRQQLNVRVNHLLQRMIDSEVAVNRPSVDTASGKHGCVLARAVLLERRGRDALCSQRPSGRGAVRPRHGVGQVPFGQVHRRKQIAHRGKVTRFTAVTRASHR